jgi:hypothetical protein
MSTVDILKKKERGRGVKTDKEHIGRSDATVICDEGEQG